MTGSRGISACLTALAGVQAGCERIRHTPVPFSYSLLLHRTAYLYCFALPFGLVDTTGFMTPFVVGLVSYTFFGLDAIGDEIEEPFGLLPNDLPLESMCRRVEIDLLEPNPDQPRTVFREGKLDELAASIQANGIVQPLLVRRHDDDAVAECAGFTCFCHRPMVCRDDIERIGPRDVDAFMGTAPALAFLT